MHDPARYCREIETYLCQKNGGHLVRIVGPAFEQVCAWAEQGVPLKVAFRGIDRYCERSTAKAGRRRPVRIEFCEADILDVFDEWRRAIGVVAADGEPGAPASTSRKPSLATHIERAIARLRAGDVSGDRSPAFVRRIDRVTRELEALAADARAARGEGRSRILDRLEALDTELLSAAEGETPPARSAELKKEAEAELAPFALRMSSEARDVALRAAFQRLVRDEAGLPRVTYD